MMTHKFFDRKKNVGIIVRSDNSGLRSQSEALCEMLNPDRVMIVDSTSFNGNEQHHGIYDKYPSITTVGWPTAAECDQFMFGLTHVLTAETVYNEQIFWSAKKYNVKVFIQPNWEFLDHLIRQSPQPHKWLMPSHWHLEDMKAKFPNTVYLPPPVIQEKFLETKEINLARKGRIKFLHVVGKMAAHDRNGMEDVLEALRHATGDFTITFHTQFPLDINQELLDDPRVIVRTENLEDSAGIYKDFDAVIMPRRYGGLCLPMNEALTSGLPVIMSDISPNNQIIQREWLVPAEKTNTFIARVPIDVHTTNAILLGKKMDEFANMSREDLKKEKEKAIKISYEWHPDNLYNRYVKEMEL